MKITAILAAAALAASAPAFAAAPTPEQVAQFKVGESTVADVTAALGKPQAVTLLGGKTVLTYSTTRSHVKASSFVPIVGLFAGGGSSQTAASQFIFGEGGKLLSTTSTTAGAECSTAITGISCK